MYTYIVIDDEPLIRRGTIKKLEGFPNISCIAQASNGQTALQLIQEKNPDFIITDMKMPVMDGSRLLPVLSSNYPEKYIIVISGYKDFEYAAQALRANTIDYIVKPFSQETLCNSVSKVISKLEHKASLNAMLTMSAHEKENLKYEYDCQLLKNLLFGTVEKADDFTSQKLKTLLADCHYFLMTVNLTGTLDSHALSEFLAARDMNSFCVPLIRENTNNMVFLLVFISENDQHVYINKANSVRQILDLFFDSQQAHPSYGISFLYFSPNNLHKAFLEAAEALNQFSLIPVRNYAFYETSDKINLSLHWPKLEQFLFLAESGKTAEVQTLFPELFHYFARTEQCRLKDAKDYCMEIVEILRKSFPKEFSLSRNPAASLSILNNLNFIYSFSELQEYFLQIFSNFSTMFENIGYYSERDVMEQIKRYIDLHYEKDLTLEFVASLFHLNRSYLSSAFKNRTGISFVDYINRVRIDHAKELLQETEKKTYQIAQAVGYENAKYFFRVFKKLEGITPEQYRTR